MLELRLKDIIDIVVVAILMFQVYRLLRGTSAVNIFIAVLGFIVTWFLVSFVFHMELLGSIMNKVVNVGAIVIIILFQDEIRNFISNLGVKGGGVYEGINKFLFGTSQLSTSEEDMEQIIAATSNFARTKTGALIVIQHTANLDSYSQTGEMLHANIKSRLIENIFFKNTPLHDGAMIIDKHKIRAAGCILPISRDRYLPKSFGLRHRAAVGITERTDAGVIVVSEETGRISYFEQSTRREGISIDQLRSILVPDSQKNTETEQ